MDSFFKMVDVQTVLFIYMAVGFGCRKAGIFNDVARDKLTDFVVFVTLPCMIFESFNMAFSLESLKQGALALLIAVGMSCVALLLGKVLYNRFPYEEKSILQYGTLVSNSGFAGLPVVSGAYGDEGLFLGSLFIIPTRILMWRRRHLSIYQGRRQAGRQKGAAQPRHHRRGGGPGADALSDPPAPLRGYGGGQSGGLHLPHGHGPGGGHPGGCAPENRL